MKDILLSISAVIFAVFGIFDIIRFILKWSLTVGPVTVSSTVGIWTGIFFIILAVSCFLSKKKE